MKHVSARATLLAALIAVFAAPGCGGPSRLDTTSPEALKASLKSMTSRMTEDQKKAFAQDMTAAVLPGAMAKVFKDAFANDKSSPAKDDPEVFKPLHGMTVERTHDTAEQERRTLRKRLKDIGRK
jgi:hypothetical protein